MGEVVALERPRLRLKVSDDVRAELAEALSGTDHDLMAERVLLVYLRHRLELDAMGINDQ